MNLLITGFAPFGRETVNPSYEAVKLLPDHIGGIKITKAEMPVSFAASGPALKAAMARHRPDAVLCVGQAGGKTPPPPSMELSQIVRGLELAIQALA